MTLFGRLARKRSNQLKNSNRRSLRFESLESRMLLAGDTFEGFNDGANVTNSSDWSLLGASSSGINKVTTPGASGLALHFATDQVSVLKYKGFTKNADTDFYFSFELKSGSSIGPNDRGGLVLSYSSGSKNYVAVVANRSGEVAVRTGKATSQLFNTTDTVIAKYSTIPEDDISFFTISGSWTDSTGELSVSIGGETHSINLGTGALPGKAVGVVSRWSDLAIDNIDFSTEAPVVENADFNDDGRVDGADFLIWQRGFGTDAGSGNTAPATLGNANDDQFIDGADLPIWASHYGKSVGMPPVANAGLDRIVYFPATQIVLTGSATDPGGSVVSTVWSQLSGPNTASLSNDTSETLTASNLVEGTYEFELTATDNHGNIGTDTALVHVSDGPIEVQVFPPPAVAASNQYSAQVFIDGAWVDTFVNFDLARTDGAGSDDEPGKTFSWTTFQTAGPVQVRVKRLEGGFNTAVVRPTSDGITTTKIGNDTVEFTLLPGQKVSVEFDTEIHNNAYTGPPYGLSIIKDAMMVFADPLETTSALDGIPESDIYRVSPGSHETIMNVSGGSGLSAGKSTLGDANGKKVVVFEPGVYDIGYWQVPNNIDQIHIEGGAVVFGALDVIPQGRSPFYDAATINQVYRDGWYNETLRSSFALTGSGILSGDKLPWHLKKDFSYTSNDDYWAHVKLVQLAVANITLEDVTMVNSPHWTLTFMNDVDSRSMGTFDNFKIVGSWTYNNDGLPNPAGIGSSITNAFIHADDDALKIYNNSTTIDNVVLWQSNNGAAFQFGWFPKSVQNVAISNIDVIHYENWYGVNGVNRALVNFANAGGSGTIKDISFTNFNVEGEILRLFGFDTLGSAQVIKDFTFTNLNVPEGIGAGNLGGPGDNYFIGDITNFHFENFVYEGAVVANATQADFDFADGAGSGFTFASTPVSSLISSQLFGAAMVLGTAEEKPSVIQVRIETSSSELDGKTLASDVLAEPLWLQPSDNKRADYSSEFVTSEEKELPDIDLLLEADPYVKFGYYAL